MNTCPMKMALPELSLRRKLRQVPSLRLMLQDVIGLARQPEHDHRTHLRAAIDWLWRVHQQPKNSDPAPQTPTKFDPELPHNTTYLIETFVAAAQALVRPALLEHAHALLDRQLKLQLTVGRVSVMAGSANAVPSVVFQHGQILHGLIAGYQSLGRLESLEAGLRAAQWLVAQQDDDGCFRTLNAHSAPYVYDTHALWAVAAVGTLTQESSLIRAARRKLDWGLGQQTPSGWFANNALIPNQHAALQSIAHTARGYIEAAVLLDAPRYLEAAERVAQALMTRQHDNGGLPGIYDDGWTPGGRHHDLPGLAHMTLCWLRLAQLTGNQGYREAAWRAMAYLKSSQRISDKDPAVRGAVLGTSLNQDAYSRFGGPQGATKFFADALMMDMTNIAIPPALSPNRMTR